MKTAAGISILILGLSLIVYFLIFSPKDHSQDTIGISPADYMHKIYTIREIDSLSAEMNYRFTIKNAVVHLHNDSLKVPVKSENPAI